MNAACDICGLVQGVGDAPAGSLARCGRCGEHLVWRKPDTLRRTGVWALAALFLAAPAYLFPLGSVEYLGNYNEISMVLVVARLFEMQHYLIGTFVLGTAVMAPVARILGLLVLSAALRGRRWRALSRGAHAWCRAMGPWDIAPVFLIALTVGIVKFGEAGNVHIGLGGLAFALMVAAGRSAVAAFDGASAWENSK